MNSSRTWRLTAAAAATLLLVAAALGCGSRRGDGDGGGASRGEQGKPAQGAIDPATARFDLTIGDLVPLTGPLKPFGGAGRKAANLALREARRALREARVKGVKVRVAHADTATNPRTSVTAARKLVRRGAGCLAGPWASADTIAVAQQVAEPDQVPLISPASTSAQITTLEDSGYAFRTAPSNNLQGETLADVVDQELGGTDNKIAVAGRNDAYGQGLVNGFRRAWEAKGGELAGAPVLYDPRQPDLSDEAQNILDDNPDGYVIADFPDSYARIGSALLRTGKFNASKLFVTDGIAGGGLPRTIPARALQGTRGTRPGTATKGPSIKAFGRLYSKAKQKPKARQLFDAQNFDAATVCFLAAVAAGSNKGEAIKSKIRAVTSPPGRQFRFNQLGAAVKALRRGEDIDYQGASGPVDLDADGDPLVGTYDVFRFGRNRSFRVLRQVQARQGQGVVQTPAAAAKGAKKGGSATKGGSSG